MKTDAQVAAAFRKHKAITNRGLSKQYSNTKMNREFYSGNTMSYKDEIQYMLPKARKQRAMVQFNKVMPYVDAVSGFMAQNRRQVKYVARVDGDQKQMLYSKYANAATSFVRDNANADQIESEQDLSMLVDGYGALETDISYIIGNATRMPGGEVIMQSLDGQNVGWDPTCRKKNLLGSRWVYYYNEYDIQDALDLFSGSNEEDFEAVLGDSDDREYYFNPYGGKYDKMRIDDAVEWSDEQEKLVKVYNYQWFEYESFYRAKNPLFTLPPEIAQIIGQELQAIADEAKSEYGDLFDFDPSKPELTFDGAVKAKLVKAFGKYIEPVEFKRQCYYTAVLSGSHIFTKFKSICQQDYSIQFKTGTYDTVNKIWIGMVNSMREPQLYYNKTLTELMFTIATNSKGGVIVEKGAVSDISKFEQQYAKTDAVIWAEDGAVSGNKIMPKGTNKVDSGLENLLQLTDGSISAASGIDKSFLGTTNAQETGVLYQRRIKQTISQMAKYFDSITLFQKMNGRLLLDYMRVFAENNDGQEFEVLEQGKYQTAVIASDKFAAQYGVTIQEAPISPEDKRETANLISTMGDKLLAAGDATTAKVMYAIGLKGLDMDMEDLAKITEALQANNVDPAAYQQLQQQVQLLTSQTNQADAEQKHSSAQLNLAKIQQIQSDIGKVGVDKIKTLEDAHKTSAETSIMIHQAKNPQPTQPHYN